MREIIRRLRAVFGVSVYSEVSTADLYVMRARCERLGLPRLLADVDGELARRS